MSWREYKLAPGESRKQNLDTPKKSEAPSVGEVREATAGAMARAREKQAQDAAAFSQMLVQAGQGPVAVGSGHADTTRRTIYLSAKWPGPTAKEGALVKLYARSNAFFAPDGCLCEFRVIEQRPDGAEEEVGFLEATVRGAQAFADWKAEASKAARALAGRTPTRYVFEATIKGKSARSDTLTLESTIDVVIQDAQGKPIEAVVVVRRPDGHEIPGRSDAQGRLVLQGITPGPFTLLVLPVGG